MNKYLLLIGLAACATKYRLELHPETTPPVEATLLPDRVTIPEGITVLAREGLRENDNLVDGVKDDDLIVSTGDAKIAVAQPGPKSMQLVISGNAPGETKLIVRYKGNVVQELPVTVSPQ